MSRLAIVGSGVAVVYALLALIHVVWAARGRSGSTVIPTVDGRPTFAPSRLTTLAVAAALTAAALTVLLRVGMIESPLSAGVVRAGTGVLGTIFVLRAIGDFRLVGFFKTVRTTPFATNDTLFFSPLSLALGGTVLWLAATPAPERADPIATPRGYTVVRTYPHDSTAYTQGLIHDPAGFFLESTGLYGHSDRRRVEMATGRIVAATPLPSDRFGEGLALHGGRLYQLTWQSGIAYVADSATLRTVDSIPYSGEGWGLASDGTSLIMSDGTDTLRFRDPATFKVRRALGVHFATKEPVGKLNELEYAGGEIFANVYESDWMVRIDATSGLVLQVLDLGGLMPGYGAGETSENVLNGIARDSATGHLFVTGKRWPTVFEIKLDPRG